MLRSKRSQRFFALPLRGEPGRIRTHLLWLMAAVPQILLAPWFDWLTTSGEGAPPSLRLRSGQALASLVEAEERVKLAFGLRPSRPKAQDERGFVPAFPLLFPLPGVDSVGVPVGLEGSEEPVGASLAVWPRAGAGQLKPALVDGMGLLRVHGDVAVGQLH